MSTAAVNNGLWIPDGAIKADERDSSDQLKIAIVGPQKGGKSRLAATAFRKPIYFWDFDGRLISVSGMEGVYGKSYLETTNLKDATAWAQVMQDMNMFEYQKQKGQPIPATMVFDSMTFMMERAMRHVLTFNPEGARKVFLNKKEGLFILAPQHDGYIGEESSVRNMINRAEELGCDIIACFHERAEEAPDSTEKDPKYTGKYSTHPPRAAKFLPLFNELWRVRPNDQGVYKVQTKPNYEFGGATCLNISDEEVPDITKMIEKHKTKGK